MPPGTVISIEQALERDDERRDAHEAPLDLDGARRGHWSEVVLDEVAVLELDLELAEIALLLAVVARGCVRAPRVNREDAVTARDPHRAREALDNHASDPRLLHVGEDMEA